MGTNGNEVQSHCGANYGLSPGLVLFMKPGDLVVFNYNGQVLVVIDIIGDPTCPHSQVTAWGDPYSLSSYVKNPVSSFTLLEERSYEE